MFQNKVNAGTMLAFVDDKRLFIQDNCIFCESALNKLTTNYPHLEGETSYIEQCCVHRIR